VSHPIDRANAEAIVGAHTLLLGWRAEIPAVRSALELIGRAESRWQVPTPAAVIDLDALVDNVNRMQGRVDANGIDLWPHAKTHKCAAIAEIQMAAGANRICTAKLGEAEALAHSSTRQASTEPMPLLVTSPLGAAGLVERACDLAVRHGDMYVVVDHLDQVSLLAEAATARGIGLGVLLDVDVGLGRTGATSPAAATAIATRIARSASLTFIGVQGYGGHWQHIVGADERHSAVAEGMVRLTDACNAINDSGLNTEVRTGGGTGTVTADLELSILTALQPGSYAAMDGQYTDALGADVDGQFHTALTVACTVISTNHSGYVTVDAGLKSMATDAGAPVPVNHLGSTFMFYGDEHGLITDSGSSPPPSGSRVELVTPHCDPTIDRYDVLHIVSGDTLIAVVPVDGRGRSQ
jgi:D-serine deaminase-like pyridoxal phosphate-dependent protein